MGIFWKLTMVLLSTLAALVIIVHSAEEDYENQNRRELRPRMLDTGTRRHEQPWRTVKSEPIMQPSSPDPFLEEITEEPVRRRRIGRKRKRRPEPYAVEDLTSHETLYPEEQIRPQVEIEDTEPVDTPKRKRKKQDRQKWIENIEEDRPVRRRGPRRKRPTTETWRELSEFNDFRPNKSPRDEEIEIITEEIDTMNSDGYYKQHNGDVAIKSEIFTEPSEVDTEVRYNRHEDNYKHPVGYRRDETIIFHNGGDKEFAIKSPYNDDKSLSELSGEEYPLRVPTPLKETEKKKEKSSENVREFLKAQHKGSIDPLTLKYILKKSNGSSLSEILQQHNLSLTDLLHGKEVALSILKSDEPPTEQPTMTRISDVVEKLKQLDQETSDEEKDSSEEQFLQNSETKYAPEPVRETTTIQIEHEDITTTDIEEPTTTTTTTSTTTSTTTEKPKLIETTKRLNIRRFPVSVRRQRIRPVINTTTVNNYNYKSPLNRDLIALNNRKYFNNHRRRNVTRIQEWRDVLPMAKKNFTTQETKESRLRGEITTPYIVEETTIQYKIEEDNVTPPLLEQNGNQGENVVEITAKELPLLDSSATNHTISPKIIEVVTEKSVTRPALNSTGLRRQAYNNVLKKKRRKHKHMTTEAPQDDLLENLLGLPNLVSSSEFIARTQATQGPKTSIDDVSMLEDFITTETSTKYDNRPKHRYPSTTVSKPVTSTTEETAKIEIEEILNDTKASAKLSEILMERNMSLSELVEHRERGSSHVHLADIFDNTSMDPNPPEPFLSKSLIEPISKETYPLRALLEANIHDTTTKGTTTEQNTGPDYVNIPVNIDFGSNVNENSENMGIMSLFHNITANMTKSDNTVVTKDSQGSPYTATITVINATDCSNSNKNAREGRAKNTEVHESNESKDDIVSWNEIFSLMRKNYENKTQHIEDGLVPAESIKKPTLEEDLDGDGLIVLEDLQHLNFDGDIATSKESLDAHTNDRTEPPVKPNTLDKIQNQTKSITLVTASIVGLAMVLFLLTYILYKWRKHRKIGRKKNFTDDRIPTPVFENRKGHKNNSSSRSISPMLTSNIYTLSTVDSQNGKESPEYMWDSLRKPFQ